VRVFLDENMPRRLLRALADLGHQVDSVHSLGWAGVANGELYKRVADTYELLFTKDDDFARRAAARAGTVKVLRVRLRQQRQDAYVAAFLAHFTQSQWVQFQSGDDWPTP
jgi:predicted nuclease of predicted toxin-antitoxin system